MSSRARIVEVLDRASGFISGDAIARELGISRTAVWKHVSALRRAGYEIEASRAKGYRLVASPQVLAPDAIQALLANCRFGFPLSVLPVTGSTNDDAAALARQGAPEGTVVLAERQTAGRGRMGRRWASLPGRSVTLSCVLRPPIPPAEAPRLSLVAALAVACAMEAEGLRARIKWPNDVLLGGRKVCGILTEIEAEADTVHFVIAGIGLNVNTTRDEFPPELRESATSMRIDAGRRFDRARITAALLQSLERWYGRFLGEPFDRLAAEWNRRSVTVGRRVRVTGAGEAIEGCCLGIDGDGALLVNDGLRTHRVVAGDVTVVGGDAR
ncbi:MAG: biotin--[acetyl-CoA-carboxylase] ligase [Candidatus Dadabacteria bacterium]|nr:MAG: biotin--[acetyl-CoA-carboxylase] ligase [Candidatus Dadabacteria bacterium]